MLWAPFANARQRLAHLHFLRKRSRLTTWPPPAGVSSPSVFFCSVSGFLAVAFLAEGGLSDGGLAGVGTAATSELGRCSAGGRAGLPVSSVTVSPSVATS